jgi:hypothetical protein
MLLLLGTLVGLLSPPALAQLGDLRVAAARRLPEDVFPFLVDGDSFGSALCALADLDGDHHDEFVVGVPQADRGAQNTGTLWILSLNLDGSVLNGVEIGNGLGGFGAALVANDNFGQAVSAVGDLDGDGIEELVVSEPNDDDGGRDTGAVWVLFLDAGGSVRAQQKISETAGGFDGDLNGSDHFGTAVAGVGDVDGDGLSELAVSTRSEKVFLLFLAADGTVRRTLRILEPPGGQVQDAYGASLAGPGDVDGDGVPDLLVGASNGVRQSSLVTCLLAPDGSVSSARRVTWSAGGFDGAPAEGAPLASSLAPLGDLDGDGRREFLMGTAQSGLCIFGPCPVRPGSAFVASLAADGSVAAEREIDRLELFAPVEILDGFGKAVATLGDLDGNGVSDIAVSAPFDDGGGVDRGAVWIVFLDRVAQDPLPPPPRPTPAGGRPPSSSPVVKKLSNESGGLVSVLHAYDEAGSSVAALGDLDDDGNADLALGVPWQDGAVRGAGAVRILFLRADHSVRAEAEIPAAALGAEFNYGNFGWSVAGLGDVDGDGIEDLAVGMPYLSRAWVLFLRRDGSIRSSVRISDALHTQFGLHSLGAALAPLGDLDGDGVRDLAALDAADGEGDFVSLCFLVFLNANGTVKAQAILNLTTGLGYFAAHLSAAMIGDLDGDGRSELAVGQGRDESVRVYFLNANGTVRRFEEFAGPPGPRFGSAVAPAGDVDADGIPDLLVGAPRRGHANGVSEVMLELLDATGRPRRTIPIHPATGPLRLDVLDDYGTALASFGDPDGDGHATVAITAPGAAAGPTNAGAVWVLDLPTLAPAPRLR